VNWIVDVRDTAGNLLDVTFLGSLRDASFNVVTLASSGGFGNARGPDSLGNFVLWAPQLQIMLLLIMVIGGSVGSTAGGAKVFRAEVAFKHAVRAIRRIRHPRGVLPIKLGEQSVPSDIVHRVIGFLTTFLLITVIGAMLVAATGAPVLESISASISAMSNMGPALGDAGPTSNFLVFSRPARVVLTVLMMIGRLELFAVLLMFATPSASLRNARARRQRGSA
jgi:trk system potassium uptake protein TrkH